MTVSDILRGMTIDNKPRFIWIRRDGAKFGQYVNVNHIVYVQTSYPIGRTDTDYGFVAVSGQRTLTGLGYADPSGAQPTIYLTEWDTADDVIRKIAALAE